MSIRRAAVTGGVVIAAAMLFAPAADASGSAASCSGHSSGGICLYKNTQFATPYGWFSQGTNVSHLSDWTYASTTQTMQDSVTSAKNLSTTCTVYVYADANYSGSYVKFPPGTQLGSFTNSAIGNDHASSIYWAC